MLKKLFLAVASLAIVLPTFIFPTTANAALTLPQGFGETLIPGTITNPTTMAFAPDGRIFALEQGGAVRVVKAGAVLATPFITLPVDSTQERGLVGITFDPNFPTDPYVYLNYTATTPDIHNRISRFTVSNNGAGDTAVEGSEVPVLDLPAQTTSSHIAGALHFGSDGYLYTSVGDNTVSANAQSLDNPFGKILRIAKDGTIPVNPFDAQTTGINKAIWAMGLRNPYTFAFQPGTGLMYINDVGERTWEEIDQGIAGANYGWPTYEGSSGGATGFTDPIYQYGHEGTGCTGSIVGASFYNPVTNQFGAQYTGKYFFTDYCKGWIKYLDPATATVSDFSTGIVRASDMQAGPDGFLYYLDRSPQALFRIGPSSDHALSAVDIGGEVAIFGRNVSGTLFYKQTSGGVFGSTWTPVGGGVASRPEAIQLGSDTYVFFRTSSNAVGYYKRSGGTWSTYQDLGGSLIGSPVAAVDGDGDLILVSLNVAGQPFYKRLSGGTWSGWTGLNGTLSGRLELTSYNGDLYLFSLNSAGNLFGRKWATATDSWDGSWTALGGILTGAPTAASLGTDLYVFGLDRNGATQQKILSGGTWGAWLSLAGILRASSDATVSGTTLTYLGVSPTNNFWSRQNTSGTWGGWTGLSGVLTTGPEAVAQGSNVYGFAMNSSKSIWYRKWDGTSWGSWTNLYGIFEYD